MKRMLRSITAFAVILYLLPASAWATELLIPGGQIVGLQLESGTVTVAAYDEVHGAAARDAGIRIGDEILAVNDCRVNRAEDIRKALENCDSRVTVTLRREGKKHQVALSPAKTKDGPRLGVSLRQGIAGIGTVTWYDPEDGTFGTLGHGVSDGKGNLLRMTGGSAFSAEILSVKKGKCGEPGQLKGTAEDADPCGKLQRNTAAGVFGKTGEKWKGELLPVAEFDEISVGPATIRSTVGPKGPQDYSVEILKIYPEDRPDHRNFLLRVTDPTLLEITGGIVQGMSGSPIIQDGKLVGAVTHVLVNDPTRGYGIFIENMLDAAG